MLRPDQVREVLALARAAGDADGASPLSEHVMLHLRHGGDAPAVHLLIEREGDLVGYAHLDTTDLVEGPSAELVVHPMHRRRGLGRALVLAATAAAAQADPAGRLRLWAHGDHPSATALALSLGFDRSRVLYQLRRSLLTPLPAPVLPPGVTLRPFEVGRDEAAWLRVNARAFADLPDQGGWTLDDLRIRMAEPWFDPAGFLLAEAEPVGAAPGSPRELVGFHWTKVHGDLARAGNTARAGDAGRAGSTARAENAGRSEADGGHHHDPIGEVYVLGIDPAARGHHLGTALTLAGLRYLRGLGLAQAMLYVDDANPRAISLYRNLGFARWSTDVCFRRTGH